jgi:hypothetical protein
MGLAVCFFLQHRAKVPNPTQANLSDGASQQLCLQGPTVVTSRTTHRTERQPRWTPSEHVPVSMKSPTALLTPKEAAVELAVTVEQLRALVKAGELAVVNVGSGSDRTRQRFEPSDIREFRQRRRIEACLSTSALVRKPTRMTSSSKGLDFQETRVKLRNEKLNA